MPQTRKNVTTIILSIAIMLLFADQNLIAPNMTAIAREFHFSSHEKDQKLGANIALGFFVVGGSVSLIAGYFADTCNRCTLFGIIVFCGELACLGTYFTSTYDQLLLCRICSGVGVGCASPIMFSLFADLYPNTSRTRISTLIGISMSIGISLGQLIAGIIGSEMGWRISYLIIAVPAILNILLFMCIAVEPRRGEQEHAVLILREQHQQTRDTCGIQSNVVVHQSILQTESNEVPKQSASIVTNGKTRLDKDSNGSSLTAGNSAVCNGNSLTADNSAVCNGITYNNTSVVEDIQYNESITWDKVCLLLHTPTIVLIYIQGIPGCIPWGMVYVYLNDYLSHNQHLTIIHATYCMTLFGIGSVFGQCIGGFVGQWLYNNDYKGGQCWFMGVSCICGVLPVLAIIYYNTEVLSLTSYYILLFMAGLVVSLTGPNVRSILQV